MKMLLTALIIVAIAALAGLSIGLASNKFAFPTIVHLFNG